MYLHSIFFVFRLSSCYWNIFYIHDHLYLILFAQSSLMKSCFSTTNLTKKTLWLLPSSHVFQYDCLLNLLACALCSSLSLLLICCLFSFEIGIWDFLHIQTYIYIHQCILAWGFGSSFCFLSIALSFLVVEGKTNILCVCVFECLKCSFRIDEDILIKWMNTNEKTTMWVVKWWPMLWLLIIFLLLISPALIIHVNRRRAYTTVLDVICIHISGFFMIIIT